MPVEVIKYTCAFKCGRKANGNKSAVSAHESKCWNNPQNKTCITCSNRIYEKDGDGYRNWINIGCKIAELNDVLDSCDEILTYQNSMNKRPIYFCDYHNSDSDGKVQEFADKITKEICGEEEGTKHYPFFNKPKSSLEEI